MKTVDKNENRINREIPSGCCGMTGFFGYALKHDNLSRKMGEKTSFPAMREAEQSIIIVASGFSYRHQFEHLTGVKNRHWVEAVRGNGPSGSKMYEIFLE